MVESFHGVQVFGLHFRVNKSHVFFPGDRGASVPDLQGAGRRVVNVETCNCPSYEVGKTEAYLQCVIPVNP